MAGLLSGMGLKPAGGAHTADIVLLNTCSIREKASHKVFTRLGRLRSLKESRPGMLLGVCGCVAQQEQKTIFDRAPWVDLVMGPRRISSLPRLISEARTRRRAMDVFDPRDNLVPEPDAIRRISRTRAYVTVMEGCNKNCTFCIVPFTRGRESCRSPESILREVESCVDEGLPEIELLGQNVNAWRSGRKWDFARLLSAVATVPGVRRLRFTTSHPLHFNDRIIDVMASHPNICRFLHLPLQSGSDRILKRMRRGYTTSHYVDRIERLRRALPDVALSTDIIVGFPGETDDDFSRSLRMLEQVRFDSLYSFVYSRRPGTPAERFADDVTDDEKKSRLHRLQMLQDGIQAGRYTAWVGREVEVLVEGPSSRGEGQLTGRTHQNIPVNFTGPPELVGSFVRLEISGCGRHSLKGVLRRALTGGVGGNINPSNDSDFRASGAIGRPLTDGTERAAR